MNKGKIVLIGSGIAAISDLLKKQLHSDVQVVDTESLKSSGKSIQDIISEDRSIPIIERPVAPDMFVQQVEFFNDGLSARAKRRKAQRDAKKKKK